MTSKILIFFTIYFMANPLSPIIRMTMIIEYLFQFHITLRPVRRQTSVYFPQPIRVVYMY